MSNIKPYTKNGKTFYHVKGYLGVDPLTGKQKNFDRRNFKTKREADLAYSKAKLAFEDGDYKQKTNDYTFEEVYNHWLNVYKNTVRESTLAQVKRIFKNHVLPKFSTYKIAQIKSFHIQDAVNEWFETHASFGAYYSYTAMVFEYAYIHEYVKKNPTKKVTVPKKSSKYSNQQKEVNFYSKPELEYFLNIVKEKEYIQWHTIFRLLAYTGMRKSELTALQWKDVDLNEGTIDINKGLVSVENNQLKLQPPKYDSYRVLGIDQGTTRVLKNWKIHQAKRLLGFGYNSMDAEQLVFSNQTNNEFLQPNSMNGALDRITKKHNLKKITPHGFRHTHASLLFESGAKMDEVKSRLGHANVETTINVYTHITPQRKDKSAQRFAEYMNI